ncbi:MAG: DUF4282 domain-containing protein [Pseudomonadota bacterium]
MESGNEGRTIAEPGTGAESGLLRGLFDWRFRRYLTMQLLPLFYVLLILAAVAVIAGLVVIAFLLSPAIGLVTLVIAPFVLLVAVAIIRAVLEYLVMAHRIMRVVENMERIPGHVDQLTARIDVVVGHVDALGEQVQDIHRTVGLPGKLLRRRSKDKP